MPPILSRLSSQQPSTSTGLPTLSRQQSAAEGYPVQIVTVDNDGHLAVNNGELLKILERCGDYSPAVMSIVGDMRQGKSTILNYVLQYLDYLANETILEAITPDFLHKPWMKNVDLEHSFYFKAGQESVTTGINMWSHPFIISKGMNGEKMAVLLMDSQGTFNDDDWEITDFCVFALATIISSNLVINMMGNIDENALTKFNRFFEFGRKLMDDQELKTDFGQLTFLIRDYKDLEGQSPIKYLGWHGGQEILRRFLSTKTSAQEEVNRNVLLQLYPNLSCCLLPYPGDNVTAENFTGRLEDMTPEFRKHLENFIKVQVGQMEARKSFVLGGKLHALDLLAYFGQFVREMSKYQRRQFPTVRDIQQHHERIEDGRFSRELLMEYVENMLPVLQTTAEKMRETHEFIRKQILEKVKSPIGFTRRMAGGIAETQLMSIIDRLYNEMQVGGPSFWKLLLIVLAEFAALCLSAFEIHIEIQRSQNPVHVLLVIARLILGQVWNHVVRRFHQDLSMEGLTSSSNTNQNEWEQLCARAAAIINGNNNGNNNSASSRIAEVCDRRLHEH